MLQNGQLFKAIEYSFLRITVATILSGAMMLKYSFGLQEEAKAIEDAVTKVLAQGYRTGDIMSEGMKKVGCKEMGRLIIENL